VHAVVKWLPRPADYLEVWRDMQAYTANRAPDTPDALWLCEHAPVYTLGQAGKPEHVLDARGVPVVRCDRGGQVTYHGPGQLVLYTLVDLRRAGLYVKQYVAMLEDVVIDALDALGVTGCRKPGAPGVYVPQADGELAKIAALGIKVSSGCTYHGLALNVRMDLAPFLGINPCGYEGMRTVDLATCGVDCTLEHAGELLSVRIVQRLQASTAARTGVAA
jgi:lipoyl(octanoyl) transferase